MVHTLLVTILSIWAGGSLGMFLHFYQKERKRRSDVSWLGLFLAFLFVAITWPIVVASAIASIFNNRKDSA